LYTVYGIALGPGDPELITLKALKVLKGVDLIYYPGSITKDQKKSFVYPILQYHGLENKELKGFFLHMSHDRSAASQTYVETAKNITEEYRSGKKIAIVCEGDISLYASFSYILTELQKVEIPISLIPGINSFSLGASKHQIPISLLGEKVAIIPRVNNIQEITDYFKEFNTIILMKIRSGWNNFHSELLRKDWNCYYCERLGTHEEYITTDIENLVDREIPYFSLLIIKKPVSL